MDEPLQLNHQGVGFLVNLCWFLILWSTSLSGPMSTRYENMKLLITVSQRAHKLSYVIREVPLRCTRLQPCVL